MASFTFLKLWLVVSISVELQCKVDVLRSSEENSIKCVKINKEKLKTSYNLL